MFQAASMWPWMLAAAVSAAFQVIFIYFIRKTANALAGCNDDVPYVLRLTAVAVLTFHSLGEVFETVQMSIWFHRLPLTKVTQGLQYAHHPETLEVLGVASGVSRWYKGCVYLLVVLPKLAIGLALWWFGAAFIARSQDEKSALFRTMSVLFVLQIDDQLAKVTVPEAYARALKNLPRVPLFRVDPEYKKQPQHTGKDDCKHNEHPQGVACPMNRGNLNEFWFTALPKQGRAVPQRSKFEGPE